MQKKKRKKNFFSPSKNYVYKFCIQILLFNSISHSFMAIISPFGYFECVFVRKPVYTTSLKKKYRWILIDGFTFFFSTFVVAPYFYTHSPVPAFPFVPCIPSHVLRPTFAVAAHLNDERNFPKRVTRLKIKTMVEVAQS